MVQLLVPTQSELPALTGLPALACNDVPSTTMRDVVFLRTQLMQVPGNNELLLVFLLVSLFSLST